MMVSRESAEILDHVQVLALLAVKIGLQGQVGHAEDAVHGSADFVAHVGQELALGLVGGLGSFFGTLQLHLGALPRCDVLGYHHGKVLPLQANGLGRHLHVDDAPIFETVPQGSGKGRVRIKTSG